MKKQTALLLLALPLILSQPATAHTHHHSSTPPPPVYTHHSDGEHVTIGSKTFKIGAQIKDPGLYTTTYFDSHICEFFKCTEVKK